MLRVISEIESVADSCKNLSKAIKRRNDGKSVFSEVQNSNIDNMLTLNEKAILRMNELLNKSEQDLEKDEIIPSINIEKEINKYRNQLRNENIENIDNQIYTYQDGVYYMDIVSECERLGDYVINIAQAIIKTRD